MDFSATLRTLQLGHFPCFSLPFAARICKWVFEYFMPPALARDSYGSGSGRPVRVRSTPSGQRALARQSALHLHLVSAAVSGSGFRFHVFHFFPLLRSCFGLSKRATHGTNWTTRPPDPPPESVPNILCTYRPSDTVPAGSLNSNFNWKRCSIMNTHTVGLINMHTHSHSFACEWTNTRQKCVWNF